MPYGFLALAVASLGMLGVLHKVADHRGCRPEGINMFIFLGGAMTMTALLLWNSGTDAILNVPAAACIVGAVCGLLASLAILAFQHGVGYGKISTSWLIINLSMVLPTLLSIIVYREVITLRRAIGLLLAIATLLILWREQVQEEATGKDVAPKAASKS